MAFFKSLQEAKECFRILEQQNWSNGRTTELLISISTRDRSQLTSPNSKHSKTKRSSSSWHEQHSLYPAELPVGVPCTEQHRPCSILQQNQASLTQHLLQSQTLEAPSHVVPAAIALISRSGFPQCSNSSGFSEIRVLLHVHKNEQL